MNTCHGVEVQKVSFTEAFWLWVKVALNSFGGPTGQIAVMHRYLVEEKRWISESRFLHALNYCMLLPGPEAQQLATYIGWLLHKTWGGVVAGTLFVIPGFICLLVLSILYTGYQDLTLVQALFFGLKPAVLAIVLEAVLRIGKKALKTRLMVVIAGLAFVAIFFYDVPFPIIILSAAIIGYTGGRFWPAAFAAAQAKTAAADACNEPVVDVLLDGGQADHIRPSIARFCRVLLVWSALWFGPILLILLFLGPQSVYFQQAAFFSKTAVVTFGGGICRTGLRRPTGSGDLWLAQTGRNAGRIGSCRDHARPAHPGIAVRRFSRGLSQPGGNRPHACRSPRGCRDHLGDLCPMLSVDLSGSPVR